MEIVGNQLNFGALGILFVHENRKVCPLNPEEVSERAWEDAKTMECSHIHRISSPRHHRCLDGLECGTIITADHL